MASGGLGHADARLLPLDPLSLRVPTQMLACFSIAFIVSLSHLMPGKPSMISTIGEASFVTLLVHIAAMTFLNMSFVLTQGGNESTCKPGDCPSMPPCALYTPCVPDNDAPVSNDTLYSIAVLVLIGLLQVRPPQSTCSQKGLVSGNTLPCLTRPAPYALAGWELLDLYHYPALHIQALGHQRRQLARATPPGLASVVSLALANHIRRLLAHPIHAGSGGAAPQHTLFNRGSMGSSLP